MGTFYTDALIGNVNGGDMLPVTALVDTGASDSAFPADLLESLQIRPMGNPVVYYLADGSTLACPRGEARLSITLPSGQVATRTCPVAFWPDDSGQCIGATALQVMALVVDAANEELAAASGLRRGWAGDIPL